MRPLNLLITIALLPFLMISCKDDESTGGGENSSDIPNILLIIADDFGKDACLGYNEGTVKGKMPTISSFINNGVIFDNFWVHPLCTPTRSSILTGKFPLRNNMLVVGDVLATSEKSLHSYIDEQVPDKYASAVIGKWHVGTSPNHPDQLGVPYYSGLLSGAVKSYTSWDWTHDGVTETSTEYSTTKITNLAIDWVGQQSKPWFLWLAYNSPHTPFHLPPNDLHEYDQLPTDEASIAANPLPYYVAMIDAMDSEIDRLLSSMSESERNNTIIIFIGDNGTPNEVAQLPYTRIKAKNSLYLGGVNTPMIISGPGISPGTRNTSFIQSTDLFATIAELAGVSIDEINDSKSFKEELYGASQNNRGFLYSEIGGNRAGHTIRNDSFHLIKFDSGKEVLFNLFLDPSESNDLSTSTDATTKTNKIELENQLNSIRN